MNYEPFTSIENPTLAHFRHSVPRSFPTDCTILKGVRIITYFQTHSFLTNKPNFGKAQKNINIYYIKDYQIISRWRGKKTNPIQTQSNPVLSAFILSFVEVVEWANLQKAKMNISYVKTTNYEQKTMNYANNKQTQSCPP